MAAWPRPQLPLASSDVMLTLLNSSSPTITAFLLLHNIATGAAGKFGHVSVFSIAGFVLLTFTEQTDETVTSDWEGEG